MREWFNAIIAIGLVFVVLATIASIIGLMNYKVASPLLDLFKLIWGVAAFAYLYVVILMLPQLLAFYLVLKHRLPAMASYVLGLIVPFGFVLYFLWLDLFGKSSEPPPPFGYWMGSFSAVIMIIIVVLFRRNKRNNLGNTD